MPLLPNPSVLARISTSTNVTSSAQPPQPLPPQPLPLVTILHSVDAPSISEAWLTFWTPPSLQSSNSDSLMTDTTVQPTSTTVAPSFPSFVNHHGKSMTTHARPIVPPLMPNHPNGTYLDNIGKSKLGRKSGKKMKESSCPYSPPKANSADDDFLLTSLVDDISAAKLC